ncbi:MAG: UvrD-helicase domain-containing protein, partial [Paenibacillaceae bacterium]|nr:UvrD-helicase domain-containing protein [Paenibacillaceae bacterium]
MTTILEPLAALNAEQARAVQCTEGPLLILAGAGSGKTRVLTHRIAYLIHQKKVSPRNILAITFTNKAAKEMRSRLEALLRINTTPMWVCTFHAMCVRILRAHIDRLGYANTFTILDTTDQLSVVKTCIQQLQLDPKLYDARMVLGMISKAKNADEQGRSWWLAVAGHDNNRRIAEAYEQQLRHNQCLDFDDLIMLTNVLLSTYEDVCVQLQQQFSYIHVDEYQDTNMAQYRLCRLLAAGHHNMCVVGDADQSIYGWRGANINNILNFMRDYPNAQRVILEENYRSTANILNAANAIIAHNTNRTPKQLRTSAPGGEKVQVYTAYNDEDEVAFVAQRIQHHVKTKAYTYAEHAILYRTNAQSRLMEDMLMAMGIPYHIVGGMKFYDRKEIKDVVAYLRLIHNPNDDLALRRIVNVPRRSIGEATMEKMTAAATERGISLFHMIAHVEDIVLPARTIYTLKQFHQTICALHALSSSATVTELTQAMLDETGYRSELQADKSLEGQSRLENIDEFLSVTVQFEKQTDMPTLSNFLGELALVADVETNEDDGELSTNAIVLMTMHSAKGLEFPVVFMLGMEENIFPNPRASSTPAQEEEERRLAYVGVTRA